MRFQDFVQDRKALVCLLLVEFLEFGQAFESLAEFGAILVAEGVRDWLARQDVQAGDEQGETALTVWPARSTPGAAPATTARRAATAWTTAPGAFRFTRG
jgi:hypothetical protein